MNQLTNIGFMLLFVAMAFIIIGSLNSSNNNESNAKVAVGGFLGPIPFGFMNDKKMFWPLVTIMVFAYVFFLIIRKFMFQS